MIPRLAIALIAAAVTGAAAPAAAEEASSYVVTSWMERDGLPSSRIWSVAQDDDRYLWLGTDVGLVRFDGLRFVSWETIKPGSLPLTRASSLLVSRRTGALWVAFTGAGAIARITGRDVRLFDQTSGLPYGHVLILAEDDDGTIWAGGRAGLYALRNERWEVVDPSTGLPRTAVYNLYVDRDGSLWVLTPDRLYQRSKHAREFRQADSMPAFLMPVATALEPLPSELQLEVAPPVGSMAGSAGERLAMGKSPQGQILSNRTGHLWVGSWGHGLWHVRGTDLDSVKTVAVDGTDDITCFFQDRDGATWMCTPAGLHRLARRHVGVAAAPESTRAVAAGTDGSVWFATDNGIRRVARTQSTRYTTANGLPDSNVRGLFSDRRGAIWAVTASGIAQFAHGRFRALPPEVRIPLHRIVAITSDRRGNVWLCDLYQGVYKLTGERLAKIQTVSDVSSTNFYAVYADDADRLWVGLAGGAIGHVDRDGRFVMHDDVDGFRGNVYAFYEDREGVLWLGGVGGLARFKDGRFVAARGARNGFNETVWSIAADDEGGLWIATSAGIASVRPQEFDALARDPSHQIDYRLYDADDGVLTPIVKNVHLHKADDGTIRYATPSGMGVLDPRALRERHLPVRAQIEDVVADAQYFQAMPQLRLPSAVSNLRIDYAAITFSSPAKVRFRYRLEGFDTSWTDAGSRRQAIYTNLPPRDYRFRLIAVGKNGHSEASEAVLAFTIPPTIVQSRWFHAASVVVALLCVVGVWRYRVAQLQRGFRLVASERARISREIHDTLLQSVTSALFEVEMVAADAPASFRSHLTSIAETLRRNIHETRQTIWNLRSDPHDKPSLAESLRDSGEKAAAQHATRFKLRVSGRVGACPPAVEESLLKIGQEAIMNAARHARATEIRAELRYDTDRLQLRVIDNGCGFDQAAVVGAASGHLGIISMRERADNVRGALTIVSNAGGGTQIEITVPMHSHARMADEEGAHSAVGR